MLFKPSLDQLQALPAPDQPVVVEQQLLLPVQHQRLRCGRRLGKSPATGADSQQKQRENVGTVAGAAHLRGVPDHAFLPGGVTENREL